MGNNTSRSTQWSEVPAKPSYKMCLHRQWEWPFKSCTRPQGHEGDHCEERALRDRDDRHLVAEGSMSRKAPKVFCDYCSGPSQLVEDSEVYSRPQQKTSAQTGVFCALAILSPFRFC